MFIPLINRFRFPGISPALDLSHPAARKLRMACVAGPATMRNLLNGYIGFNSGGATRYENNVLGPTCYCQLGLQAINGYIAIPSSFPGEILSQCTLAVIFMNPGTSSFGQGMVGDNGDHLPSTPSLKIQTAVQTVNGIANTPVINSGAQGTTTTTIPYIIGNPIFTVSSLWHSANFPNCHHLSLDMNTGQILYASGTIGGSGVASGSTYNIITYSATAAANPGRVAAAMLSASYMSIGQMMAWAQDPWSLWYKRTPFMLPLMTGRKVVIGIGGGGGGGAGNTGGPGGTPLILN